MDIDELFEGPPMPNRIFTEMETADVAQMAVIECLRQIADGSKKTGQVLEGMQAELRDVRERVIRIEASEFKLEVQEAKALAESARQLAEAQANEIKGRLALLEADKNRRDGAISAWDWLLKSWPALIGFILLVGAVLIANGRLEVPTSRSLIDSKSNP